MREAWSGIVDLLRDDAVIVIRIGGAKLEFESAADELARSLREGLSREIHAKSAIESRIVGGQLRSFRPSANGTRREFDFVFELA